MEFLGDKLASLENIRAGLKDACENRQSDNRRRANRFQICRSIERRLEGQGHELLCFFSRHSGRLGLNHNLWWSEVRKHIQRRLDC